MNFGQKEQRKSMNAIIKMALKDIKLLLRDRMGAFFLIGFPILMGLFFGLIMGGPSSGNRAQMKIAIVDQDASEISKKFVDNFSANGSVAVEQVELETARQSVRKGQRVGMIVLPEGFGETAGVFWEEPPKIQLGMDPSRSAEAAMIQGFVMEAIGGLVGERFDNPSQFKPFVADSIKQVKDNKEMGLLQRQTLLTLFGSFDKMLESMDDLNKQDGAEQLEQGESGEPAASATGLQFANIESIDITKEIDPKSRQGQLRKIRSKWDLSFPQAMLWGIMACAAGFAISIARENSMGTMLRLKTAPISRFQILAGKALACFLTVLGVITFMTLLGVLLGLAPTSYPKLILAAICTAFCFVGIMMTMSVLGKTEQSVNGIGWAINMVLAMLGGAMIPVMFMPDFIQKISVISPIKWSILSIEGAIWRDFSYAEIALPCGILLAVGAVFMAIGALILGKRQ